MLTYRQAQARPGLAAEARDEQDEFEGEEDDGGD